MKICKLLYMYSYQIIRSHQLIIYSSQSIVHSFNIKMIGKFQVFLILYREICYMKFDKIHNKGKAQLFQNEYLEYLTKTHPLVIWGLYLPLIIYFPYYTAVHLGFDGLKISLLFISGMFFWTFFEYIMHRFVFHWVGENAMAQRIVYVVHGNHHEYPRDRERL